ncbi:MAG TPA: glycogen debranching enzyme, partial [Dongiaceae bacterium]|nr:glycogen debranching enzyme [Dongiaceae bacterium]
LHRFVTLLNAQRVLRGRTFERRRMSLNQLIRRASKAWHGVKLGQPDWSRDSHSLAFEASGPMGLHIYAILNAYWEPLEFELPPVGADGAGPWHRWIDTSLDSPQDILPVAVAPGLSDHSYRAGGRSVVILFRDTAKRMRRS